MSLFRRVYDDDDDVCVCMLLLIFEDTLRVIFLNNLYFNLLYKPWTTGKKVHKFL